MQAVIDYVLAQRILIGLVIAGAAVYAGTTLWSNGSTRVTTIAVQSGDFIQQVSVSGKVMAAQEVDLGFSQSGRIAGVYAKEGQFVSTGALIAEVENGDLYAAVVQRRAAQDVAEARLDALKRGTRPEEIAIAESAVTAGETALAAAQQAVVDAIFSAYSIADNSVHATADQLFSNANTASPQVTFLVSNATVESLVESSRVNVGSSLNEWKIMNAQVSASGDLATASAQAQRYLADVSQFLSDMSAALAVSLPTGSMTQSSLDTYKTSVGAARTSLDSATSALTTALRAQAAAAAALVTAQRDLLLKRAGTTAEDIRAQEATVQAAVADVQSALSQLEKTQIRAPFSGTVTKIDAKVGESVSPGQPQVALIGTGTFQIESFVPELNVSLVKPGDPATVTFDSYGPNVLFDAKVLTVDLGETTRDGVTTYRTLLTFTGKDERIRSGMTANVLITTETKSDVITIPQTLVQHRDGGTNVRVRVGDQIEVRSVVTGSVSSSGDIEILSGLLPGDLVVVE